MQEYCPVFFMDVKLALLLMLNFHQHHYPAMFHLRCKTIFKCKDLEGSWLSGVDGKIIKNQFHQTGHL